MSGPYTAKFTHEFPAGPSGPARSYWLIEGPGASASIAPICLHHRESGMQVDLQIASICHALNTAHRQGRQAMADDTRNLLTYPNGDLPHGRRT